MAGDWIKIEHVTPDKPEVIEMADRLEIDQDAVLGKLIRLWVWADEQSLCDAASVTETFVDRLSRVTGFAKAMISVGWLVAKNGRLTFSNFDRHNGETAKKRALTQKRAQKFRNASVTQNVTHSALPEKRREDINPLPPLGKSTSNPTPMAQSVLKAQQLIEEQRGWSAAPMPESLKPHKPAGDPS